MRPFLAVVCAASLMLSCASVSTAQENDGEAESATSSPTDELAAARLEYMLKALGKYTVVLDGDDERTATVNADDVLRWSNPLGDVVDGLLTVYTTGPGERPAALAHYHVHGAQLNGLEMFEFADVYPGPIEVRRNRQRIWSPEERYSEFKTLEDGPQPHDNASLRLAQMKRVAERFEVIDGFRQPNSEPIPEKLRMIPRPTYRYGGEDQEVIDGALFTFVIATDPEACLLLEIVRGEEGPQWRYALFPLTIYSLDANFDGEAVWHKPEAMVFGNPTAPHYIASYRGDTGEARMRSLFPPMAP